MCTHFHKNTQNQNVAFQKYTVFAKKSGAIEKKAQNAYF